MPCIYVDGSYRSRKYGAAAIQVGSGRVHRILLARGAGYSSIAAERVAIALGLRLRERGGGVVWTDCQSLVAEYEGVVWVPRPRLELADYLASAARRRDSRAWYPWRWVVQWVALDR